MSLEVTLSVIVKKNRINMRLILNGYRQRSV
jgi:hypothetical protein